jgi:hypothetical protein
MRPQTRAGAALCAIKRAVAAAHGGCLSVDTYQCSDRFCRRRPCMRSAVLITPGGVCTISAVVTARHPLSMLRTASMDVGPRRQGIQPGLAPSEVCPDWVSIRSRGMRTQGKSPPCWHHDLHASSQHSPSFRPRGILCPHRHPHQHAPCARALSYGAIECLAVATRRPIVPVSRRAATRDARER